MRELRWLAFGAVATAVLAGPATADVVRLRNGDIVEGKAKDLGESVQVTSGATVVEMPWSAVEVIDREATAAGDLVARRALVKEDDAHGLLSLALSGLGTGVGFARKFLA